MRAAPVALVVLLLLAACASDVVITPAAQRVRQITPGLLACRFIGQEFAQDTSGTHPENCTERAFDKMRNRVAEMGGNGYVILGRTVDACLLGGTRTRFEAYRCPEP